MQIPVESKTGLGSVGLFSSLFLNQNIHDNTGDLKTQFALTPVPDNLKGEGPKLAHTAPRRQLVLTLSGCLEFKSCDVDEEDTEHKVTIRRGDILLAEDLEGAGHVWKFVESSPDREQVVSGFSLGRLIRIPQKRDIDTTSFVVS